MKAGAKQYLLSKFDRQELRGKAAGEPARATHVRLRRENSPTGPPFPQPIVELLNALTGLRISSSGLLKRSQVSRTHILRKPNKRVEPPLVGEPTSSLGADLRVEVFCRPCKYHLRPRPRPHWIEPTWKPF